MRTVLIDYDSGNLHSAEKAFARMADETSAGTIEITDDPVRVASADRVVLPGDGAFPACRHQLYERTGLFEAMNEAVTQKGRPFLGICVGMQLMATRGLEYAETSGLNWIAGDVTQINAPGQKVPHMGWNDLVLTREHPVLEGVKTGDHAYFVHSYHLAVSTNSDRLAHVDYGGTVTAIVANENRIGMQFHPEKSQSTGLRLISNFLKWTP